MAVSTSFKKKRSKTKPKELPVEESALSKHGKNAHLNKGLGQDFADKILDLELRIERDCAINDVNELMALYTEAVEYYSALNDEKFMDFQRKIQKLLFREDVQSAMANFETEAERRKNSADLIKNIEMIDPDDDFSPRNKRHTLATPMTSTGSTDNLRRKNNFDKRKDKKEENNLNACEKILQNHEIENQYGESIITQDLAKQNNNINQKLEARRRRKMNGGMLRSTLSVPNLAQSYSNDSLTSMSSTKSRGKISIADLKSEQDVDSVQSTSNTSSAHKAKPDLSRISLAIEEENKVPGEEQQNSSSPSSANDLVNQAISKLNKKGGLGRRLGLQLDDVANDEDDGGLCLETEPAFEDVEVENNINDVWQSCEDELTQLQDEKMNKIQECIEQIYSDKFEAISEIKVKYDSEMRNMDTSGPIGKRVLKQLTSQKEQEIATTEKKFDDRKKAEIKEITRKFNEHKFERMTDARKQQVQRTKDKLKQSWNRSTTPAARSGGDGAFKFTSNQDAKSFSFDKPKPSLRQSSNAGGANHAAGGVFEDDIDARANALTVVDEGDERDEYSRRTSIRVGQEEVAAHVGTGMTIIDEGDPDVAAGLPRN
eukprot:CAMPEP_0114998440 /NCGR_PEP_ID=MMETSP0216-20121206/15512_1 /TAXON_ID=223996 /ORGANISM="Protocruzia adherens, Strain Boccale" /LENGTH=600 /DNA_ID=CAMNT_0002363045 /DNA_START=27 /DNA_END=1829 /DNA_ORIENTATION=+